MGTYQARRYEGRNLTAYKCYGGPHIHLTRSQVDRLVHAGQMAWVGNGKRMAAFVSGRTWAKKLSANGVATMQMVPGGVLLLKQDKSSDRRAEAHGPVRRIKVPKETV